jgi:hypothetical protein
VATQQDWLRQRLRHSSALGGHWTRRCQGDGCRGSLALGSRTLGHRGSASEPAIAAPTAPPEPVSAPTAPPEPASATEGQTPAENVISVEIQGTEGTDPLCGPSFVVLASASLPETLTFQADNVEIDTMSVGATSAHTGPIPSNPNSVAGEQTVNWTLIDQAASVMASWSISESCPAPPMSRSAATPAPTSTPQIRVAVKALPARSKLRANVNPNQRDRDYRIKIQKRIRTQWQTVKKSHTRGPKDIRTVKMTSGRYRVRVSPHYGLRGATSDSVRLPRPPKFRANTRSATNSHVRFSHRPGCPVRVAQLRLLTVSHYDYSNVVTTGKLVVRRSAVPDMRTVFRKAFARKFPFKRMQLLDSFYAGGKRSPHGSDIAAMNAGNTGAFNCRPVVGNPYRMSRHSYGDAVDINTFENPYVTASRVYPAGARRYLDRSKYRRGMILSGSVVAATMSGRGWLWGARWSHPDYQHFSETGA